MTIFEDTNTCYSFDKLEYIDELILKLQMLYSKNIIEENFFDKALELLEQEKQEISSRKIRLEQSIDKIEEMPNFQDMSPQEQKKYIEIEKQGIKMRLLEAGNFSELNTIYNRILNKLDNTNDNLEKFLKKEFTNSFEKLFKSSYIFFITQDYNKSYGILDIENLIIDKDKLKLKDSNCEYSINKDLLKKQKIRSIDNNELESLKVIIKNTYSCFTEEFIEEKLRNVIKTPKKEVDLKKRLKLIKNTIQTILDRDENRFFRTTLNISSDFNFEEKLNKCNIIYESQFKDETPLIIFDNTIFKTCENGFIMTDKNFYLKNKGENAYNINIDDVDEIELRENNLYINDSIIYCDIIKNDYRDKFKETILIITYLVQNGKESSKDINDVIDQVLNI
ncbi:MAG: hypothetical protein ACLSAJ_11405 [Intestinibacter bartlettii]|uniref:hypothetical protein n=1 Tax=Intestinibacter bartlettii TaxID=261299 RepID=UPI0039A180FD